MIALVSSALVLALAPSAAWAPAPLGPQQPNDALTAARFSITDQPLGFSAGMGVDDRPDGKPEVESSHGRLRLGDALPSQRVFRLIAEGPDRPAIVGRFVDTDDGDRLLVEEITLNFARRKPGQDGEVRDSDTVRAVITRSSGEPCDSGRGCPATARTSHDGESHAVDGFVKVRMLRGSDSRAEAPLAARAGFQVFGVAVLALALSTGLAVASRWLRKTRRG